MYLPFFSRELAPETEAAFISPCFYLTYSNLYSGKPDQTPAEEKQQLLPVNL